MNQQSRYTDDGIGNVKEYLQNSAENAVTKLVQYASYLTSGNRGRYATIALNLSGISSDSKALQAVYDANPEVLNEYFEHVEIQQLARLLNLEKTVATKAPKAMAVTGAIAMIGVAVGVAGTIYYNKRKSDK